jgi:glycosyltransferase involved in cell wall biosynthesis
MGYFVVGDMCRHKVAIIVSHPIQHFVFLYKGLAKRPELEVKVFFASNIGVKPYFDKDMAVTIAWNIDLTGGYDHTFLPEADTITETGFKAINNPSIWAELDNFKPDVVQLHGYAQLTLLRALLWCKLHRIPALLWTDSSLLFKRSAFKSALKKLLLPWVVNRFDGILTTGNNNAGYYRSYGVKQTKLFPCPFTVDEDALTEALANKPILRQSLRAQYQVADGAFVFLFVAKLVERKRPQDLLHAIEQLSQRLGKSKQVVAFYAGDGVLKNELMQLAGSKKIPAIFAGFINVDVLPSIYAMADALVFPSSIEPYGLSAREAICLGLPLIVSDQIGCVGSTDAARPDQNAIVYPAGNVDQLTDALEKVATNIALYHKMAQSSLAIAHEMRLESSTNGFVKAVQAVSSHL